MICVFERSDFKVIVDFLYFEVSFLIKIRIKLIVIKEVKQREDKVVNQSVIVDLIDKHFSVVIGKRSISFSKRRL